MNILKTIDLNQLSLWGHSMGSDDVYFAGKQMKGLKSVMIMDPCFNAITDFEGKDFRDKKGYTNND